jgi:hypothetical protein
MARWPTTLREPRSALTGPAAVQRGTIGAVLPAFDPPAYLSHPERVPDQGGRGEDALKVLGQL